MATAARLSKKEAKKMKKLLDSQADADQTPIHEQTIDLPAGDGTLESSAVAQNARRELNRALREKRRAGIKEDNFLRAMR
jgi:large subunit ribosomal protein L54